MKEFFISSQRSFFIPSIVLFIVEQVIEGDYVLFNNIYLLYFASLVTLLNGFYQWKGYRLYVKINGIEHSTLRKERNSILKENYKNNGKEDKVKTGFLVLKKQIIVVITGTLFLSIFFVGAVIVSAALQLETKLISWFVFEIVIHVCLLGAVVLETCVVIFFLPEKKKGINGTKDTTNN